MHGCLESREGLQRTAQISPPNLDPVVRDCPTDGSGLQNARLSIQRLHANCTALIKFRLRNQRNLNGPNLALCMPLLGEENCLTRGSLFDWHHILERSVNIRRNRFLHFLRKLRPRSGSKPKRSSSPAGCWSSSRSGALPRSCYAIWPRPPTTSAESSSRRSANPHPTSSSL